MTPSLSPDTHLRPVPRWLPGVPRRASERWLGALAAIAAFAAAYLTIASMAGFDAIMLITLPAVVAGWMLGLPMGALAGLVLVAVGNALSYGAGFSGPTSFLEPFGAVGAATTLALAAFAGLLREARDHAIEAREALEGELLRRSRAEAALQGSEERFRLLTEAALAGVYVMLPERILYANPAFAKVFGYATGALLSDFAPADLVHPDDRDRVVASLRERVTGERDEAHYRFRGLHRDGRELQLEVMGRRVSYDGEPAVLGTLMDVTEQVHARDELETRLAALEAASNGIVITDRHGDIEWVNPAFTLLTGYSRAEAVGRSPRLLRSGKQSPAFYQQLWRTILRGDVWEGELINRRKDGAEYVEEMTIAPIRAEDGEVRRFVAIKRDVTERRQDQDAIRTLNHELERHVSRLTALREVDRAITGTAELEVTLQLLLDQAVGQLGADAAAVWLHDNVTETLTLRKGRDLHLLPGLCTRPTAVGAGVPGRVAQQRRTLLLHEPGALAELFSAPGGARGEDLSCYAAAPLIAKGSLHGVLELYYRGGRAPDESDLGFLGTLADQAAMAADNAQLLDHLERRNAELRTAYDATIEGWARALDLRDEETEGHSRRVTELSIHLAERLGIGGEDLLQMRRGALLHDIGKMGVPDAVLGKPGPLNDEEWACMKEHPGYALDLLSPIPFLRRALDIPYSHHEKWDGSGYPRGLHATQIPLPARIFAVVDVFDALTNERPYRSAWSAEKALAHIASEAGRHFDPDVTRAFLAMMDTAARQPVGVGAARATRGAGDPRRA